MNYFKFTEIFPLCLVPHDLSDFRELERSDNLHLSDVSVSEFLEDKNG